MIRSVRPNGTEEHCTYDANGLLLEQKDVVVDAAEGEKELTRYNYEYDAENRLIRYNDKDVIYNADGNMTYGPVDGEMSELVYDCRNRLVSAGSVKYTYDVENNRISAQSESYLEYGFKSVECLRVGDVVLLASGEHKAIDRIVIETVSEPVYVYNFEVEDWHTYFVSEEGVLVHNTSGQGGCLRVV